MPYVPLQKLVKEKSSSLFKLVLLAAARANELAQGAQPLLKSKSKKVSTIALEEISAGKVSYEETAPKGKKAQG
ncbi:MAG: DNA-directed RNA polymerase subunit omega [Candidatus Omnitrophica bacterium]|nr:DNA-directed RNA polymerase subunit omega [Candidatus Omnitrophota bacterium]